MADYAYGSSQRRWDSQTWSWRLGTFFDIRVRIHITFLLFAAGQLLYAFADAGTFGFQFQLTFIAMLFVIVLLHEFGHCFGCRWVGGQADDILIWPLGGLAFVNPPNRPYESLVTVLAGPAVNAVLFLAMLPLLYWQGILTWATLNPINLDLPWETFAYFLAIAFKVNLAILLFNLLLPFFPMDGGRVLQVALWYRMSHFHATMIATTVGMGGALLLCVVGIYLAGWFSHHYLMLSMVGLFGLYSCMMTRRQLELMGQIPENEFGYDFSQGYTSLERSMSKTRRSEARPSLRKRFQNWMERRRKREQARIESELDRILEKIHVNGMNSLSREERRILNQASKQKRAR